MLHRRYRALMIAIAYFLLSTPAYSSGIDYVTVTTIGVADSKKMAVQEAVVAALEQVNGQAMSVKERSSINSTVEYQGDEEKISGSEQYSQDIASKTKGVIRRYAPLSFDQVGSGQIEAAVEVTVAVLKKSKQMKRTKIAVVGEGGNLNQTDQLVKDITRKLATSRKFAVLDRENGALIEREFEKIKENGSIEDMVRLSSSVAPDLLAVVKSTLRSVNSEKYDLSGTLEVLDYATGQIKFSRKKMVRLKVSDSDSKTSRKISMLSKKLYTSLVEKVFVPTVIGSSSDGITIGQGMDYFSVGDIVSLHKRGEQLKDQYTGESLGSNLSKFGMAKIIFVNSNISIASSGDDLNISNDDIAGRKIVVVKKKNIADPVEKMKKSTKSFLDDI